MFEQGAGALHINARSTDFDHESYMPFVAFHKARQLTDNMPSWPSARADLDVRATSAAAACDVRPDSQMTIDSATLPSRHRFGPEQVKMLKQVFAVNPTPAAHVQRALALSTGITYRSIQIWFQNRRQRQRKRDAANALHGPAATTRSISADGRSGSCESLQVLADAAIAATQLPVSASQPVLAGGHGHGHGRAGGAARPARAAATLILFEGTLSLFDSVSSGSADPSSLVFLQCPHATIPPSSATEGWRRALGFAAEEDDGGYSSPAASPADRTAYGRGRLAAVEFHARA